ncbi:MAG: hypothetical protein WBF58_20035 [Xanthobacteraceae bacterium]
MARIAKAVALVAVGLAACVAMAVVAHATIGRARGSLAGSFAAHLRLDGKARKLLLAQNPSTLFTLPEMAEPVVSPINPGTLPGSTAAIGGSAIGTNPITGLPCNGAGSLAVSGAGGLPGTATPPPGLSTETLQRIPVGTPPTTSVFGSQNNLGSC